MVLWYGLCTLVIGLGLRCRRPKTRRSLSNRVTGGELISAQRNSRLAFVITSQLGCKSIAHLFHAAIISNFFIFISFNHQYYHLLHCQQLWILVFIKTFWPKIYTNIMITICTNSIPRQHGPVDIPLGISSCPSLPELVHGSLQWGVCCLRSPWGFRLYKVS